MNSKRYKSPNPTFNPVQSPSPRKPSSSSEKFVSGSILPLVDSQKAKLQRQSLIPVDTDTRRVSVPFPVTAWSTRWRQKKFSEDLQNSALKKLKGTKSQSEIQSGPKLGDKAWRVSLLVSKAKRKFSADSNAELPHERGLFRRISLSDFLQVAAMKRSDSEKKKLIRDLKIKALVQKKRLLAKFRIAVKIAIFCSRKFKEHCLRLNENRDELAPYIKRLHFHEEDNNDLLIDLSKFKANRQMRIPEETKRILSKEVTERTEREVYTVTLALRNIKSFSEYPRRMQQKIAEVGLYEKYESKRMIVRQGHPASAFYFILSGAVVVMVMDEESKYARPVAHLYKGQTFGELAIINGTKRISSVIAKETCEFMSISARDYHKIFMAGGVKNINDPDQEIFLKSLSCLADWPIHKLQETPNKCQFLFFKNGEVIVRDSHYSDWIIVVKSGSIEVLKKLRRVEAFEWKRKKPPEVLNGTKRREIILKRVEWRRILPEIRVALNPDEDSANVEFLGNGRPAPFVHPDPQTGKVEEEDEEEVRVKHVKKSTQIPNLWPFRVDISEIESGRYLDDYRGYELPHRMPTVFETEGENSTRPGRQLNRLSKNSLGVKPRDRSNSVIQEEEKELLGYQPHIRTIIDDIDAGIKRKDDEGHVDPRDINPEFVHVQTLTKGQVFGLTDLLIGDQPSLSVVSRGADCLLINKNFYMEHASEKLLREMRQELCPYPTEEEMQDRLQVSVDWQAYKKNMLSESVSSVCSRKMMRVTLNGTKTQEAFVY